jgi:membrane protein DedA with SNARE-associated domain
VPFSLVQEVVAAITTVLATLGLPGLFALMVVESFGIPPVPSEVILPFSGFLVAEGVFPLPGTLAIAVGGALVGSFVAYAVGRWWRHRILGLGFGKLRLEARHLERMDRFFVQRGELTVALARFVPGVRAYISYPAGAARMEPVRFGVYTLVGTVPFVALWVWLGLQLGSHWAVIDADLQPFNDVILALVVAGIVYVILLAGGLLAPGWPPRRPSATPAVAVGPPPGGPGSAGPGAPTVGADPDPARER